MTRIVTEQDAYAAGHRIGDLVVRKVAHGGRLRGRTPWPQPVYGPTAWRRDHGDPCTDLRNEAIERAYGYAREHPATAFVHAQVQQKRLWGPWNRGIGDAVLDYLRGHGCPGAR